MKLGLFKNSLFKNKRGVSIIQVLMAAGMTSIVSLGVVQMIENSRRMQRRTTLISTLSDLRSRLENNMRDQIAFNNTVNQNAWNGVIPWTQMASGTNVTEIPLSNAQQFAMYDAANQGITLIGKTVSDQTTARYGGYTERGGRCYDFNPVLGYGTDNCPISYRLLVSVDCPRAGETSCRDPNIVMVARLVFNPGNSTSSTMNNWRGLIPQVSGDSLVTASEKYDAEVRRTASKINRSFMISASISPDTAPSPCITSNTTNTGGGQCSVGSYAIHPLTKVNAAGEAAGWEEESDPHNMVTVNSTTGTFSVSPTGVYRCVAVAKVFGTNANIQLYNNSTSTAVPGTGTAVLGQYTEGDARLDTMLTVTSTAHNYILRQQCSLATPAVFSCSLGFGKQGYSGDSLRLLSLTCDRMDVMF